MSDGKPSTRNTILEKDGDSIKFKSAVIQELFETEKKYISNLMETYGGYYALHSSLKEFPSATICIGLMKDLADISNTLLTTIYDSDSNYFSLISAFQSLIPRMKQNYGTYVCSYSQAIYEIQNTTNAEYRTDVKEVQKCFGQVLTLESYILQPVQRVMRYKLLMDSLLKECKGTVNGFIVKTLVKELNDLNEYINELSRQREGDEFFVHMNFMIKNLDKPLKTEEVGALILKDEFTRRKKKLFVILFSKFIMITKKLKSGKLWIKYLYNLEKVNIIENKRDKKHTFGIAISRLSRDVYWLNARDAECKKVWLTHLKACILDCFKLKLDESKIKTLVGEEIANKITTILSVSDDLLKSRLSVPNGFKSDDELDDNSVAVDDSFVESQDQDLRKISIGYSEEPDETKSMITKSYTRNEKFTRSSTYETDVHVSYRRYSECILNNLDVEYEIDEEKDLSKDESSNT